MYSVLMMICLAPCSVSIHTYAVMGLNTDLIQAALMSRAKVHTIVPAKMEARVDMDRGNFKLQFIPVQDIDTIASAVYVFVRNPETCILLSILL